MEPRESTEGTVYHGAPWNPQGMEGEMEDRPSVTGCGRAWRIGFGVASGFLFFFQIHSVCCP